MSIFSEDVVDSKVVEMSLDNQRFEKNANDSISTISRLKNALDFSDAGKGFDDINRSVKNINVEGLANGIGAVSNGFSLMEGIAFGVLNRVGAKIADISMKVADMFAVAPLRDGFSEYELKMGSVQTIMASTGESLDSVNKYLEELNLYADKTIYSFSDMTSNIGKFTNAGVSLKDAVAAIQGVSNVAAVSGANAAEASRAMYNFAQALSAGYVKLIDWKSIENANMATVEFKNQLLETAEAMGTVKKQADGTYKVLTHGAGNKGMKDTISATKNFNDSLQAQWMTTDVLTTTLAKYSDETTDIGKKAMAAATEVKTFSQLMDTLKEAAGSGWAQTWELIIGDFDQAKELFTFLSNRLGGLIDGFSKSRNDFIKAAMGAPESYVTAEDWKNLNLTKKQAGALTATLIELGKANGIEFASHSVDDLVASLSQGWLTADKLKQALNLNPVETSESVENLDKLHEAALRVIRGEFGNNMNEKDENSRFNLLRKAGYDNPEQIQEYVNTLRELSGGTWNLTEEIMKQADATVTSTKALAAKSDEELKAIGWTDNQIKRLRKLQKEAEETGTPLNELIDRLENPQKSGRENLFESIKNTFAAIGHIVTMVKAAWSSVMPKASADSFRNITEKINLLSQSFKKFAINNGMKIYKFFRGLFSVLDIGRRIVVELAVAGFNALTSALSGLGIDIFGIAAKVGDLLYNFRNWIIENEIIQKGVTFLGKAIKGAIGAVKGFIDAFLNLPIVSKNINRFQSAFKMVAGNLPGLIKGSKRRIDEFIGRVKEMGGLSLENLPAIFKDFKENVLQFFLDFPGFKSLRGAFVMLAKDVKGAFSGMGKVLLDWLFSLRDKIDGTIFADIFDFVSDKVKWLITGFTGLRDRLMNFDFSIGDVFGGLKTIVSNVIDFIGNIKWFKVLKIGVGLTAVMGLLGVIKKVFGLLKSGKNFLKSITDTISSFGEVNEAKALEKKSKALTNFAIALGIMVAAIVVLTTIDQDKLWSAVAVLGVLSAMMLGVIFVIGKIQKSKGASLKASIALISIAASVAILAGALKILDSLNGDNLLRNLAVLTAMVAGMTLVAIVLSKQTKKLATGGLGLILFAAAIRVLVISLKAINDIDLKPGTMETLLAMLLGLAAATAIAKKVKLGAGAAMLLAAASVLVMVQAVKQLGEINKNQLKKGLVAITVLGLLIMGIAAVLGLVASKGLGMLAGATSLLVVSGAIVLLAFSISMLASVDKNKMQAATVCLSVLLGMMALALAVSSIFKSIPIGLVVMVAVVGLLALILGLMNGLKAKRAMEHAKAISLLLVAMSGALILLSAVGAMAGPALAGILLFVGFLTVLGLLFVGIGALVSKIPNIEKWIDKGIPVLVKVASGFGQIIEAFLTHITDAVMNTMLKIPPFLKEFLQGMKDAASVGTFNFLPLLEAVGAILVVSTAGLLSSIMSAVSNFANGKGAVEQFADDLETLSTALVDWQTKMESIDGIDIPFGAIAELALIVVGIDVAGLVDAIVAKVADFISGKTPMESFADDLEILSSALVDWQTKMEGIESIDIPFEAITELEDVINQITFSGLLRSVESLVNELVNGRSNVEQFSIDIGSLASALMGWQTTMEGFKGINIPTEGIIELEQTLNLISFDGMFRSIESLITELALGKSNVEQFSTDITELGTALSTWSQLITENTNITVDSEGIQNLVDAVNAIPAQSLREAITSKFTGQSDAESFGEDMGTLATAVNGYVTALQGVDISSDNVTASTNLIGILGTLAGDLPEQTFWDWITGDTPLGKFSENLPALGAGLAGYAAALGNNFNGNAASSAAEAASVLSTIGTNLKGQDLGSSFLWMKSKGDIEKFSDNLGYLATGLNEFAGKINDTNELKTTTISALRMVEAGKTLSEIDLSTGDIAYEARVLMIQQNVSKLVAMIKTINETSYDGVDLFKDAIDKITSMDLDSALTKLGGGSNPAGTDAGASISNSLAKGMEAGSGEVTATANDVTKSVVGALTSSDQEFTNQGTNLVKALAQGFRAVEGNSEVLSALNALGAACISVLGGYSDDFTSTGTNLSIGFSAGIGSLWSILVVKAAAYALGRAAIDSLRKAIDAHSPSRESGKLGDFFGVGFVDHIASYADSAYKSAYGMGDYARKGLAAATQAISEVLSNDLETQPVIRPILDLTDIQNGSMAIGNMLNPSTPIAIAGNFGAISANVNARNMTSNADILTALQELGNTLTSRPVQTNQYNINGITYDDGSNITDAVRTLIHAARVERRV
jgi:tape measure domain-containing protein